MPPLRTSKLQKKPSSQRSTQNMKFINFFYFCGSFLPSWIRIRIQSGSETLMTTVWFRWQKWWLRWWLWSRDGSSDGSGACDDLCGCGDGGGGSCLTAAVMPRLSYGGCLTTAVLRWLSYGSCLAAAVLRWLSCGVCFAAAILRRLSYGSCLAAAVLRPLFWGGCFAAAVLRRLVSTAITSTWKNCNVC